jgi:hypothetical protein
MTKRNLTPLFLVLAFVLGSVCTGVAMAAQPHMTNALNSLYTAQSELTAAAQNKNGHRAAALGYVNQAIAEVKLGIAAGAGY